MYKINLEVFFIFAPLLKPHGASNYEKPAHTRYQDEN